MFPIEPGALHQLYRRVAAQRARLERQRAEIAVARRALAERIARRGAREQGAAAAIPGSPGEPTELPRVSAPAQRSRGSAACGLCSDADRTPPPSRKD
jgi:hypothetical protein